MIRYEQKEYLLGTLEKAKKLISIGDFLADAKSKLVKAFEESETSSEFECEADWILDEIAGAEFKDYEMMKDVISICKKL